MTLPLTICTTMFTRWFSHWSVTWSSMWYTRSPMRPTALPMRSPKARNSAGVAGWLGSLRWPENENPTELVGGSAGLGVAQRTWPVSASRQINWPLDFTNTSAPSTRADPAGTHSVCSHRIWICLRSTSSTSGVLVLMPK